MKAECQHPCTSDGSGTCLPLSAVPHTTALFSDYVHDFGRVRQFFGRPPLDLSWLPEEAQSIHYEPGRRARVADILERQNRAWGAGPKTMESIARLRHGAVAAVTGQQVGLFGGPLFSILKALSAVLLAREATLRGVDCVPVFWLATEDHDLAEVNHAAMLTSTGELRTFIAEGVGAAGAPISQVRFSGQVESLVAEVADLLGATDIVAAIRETHQPGVTLGDAFARLFARIFADWGVVQLDASDPALHELAQPIYREALARAAELDSALLERGKALHDAGYHEQVKVTSSSTLLFRVEEGVRTVIHRANGRFSVGKQTLTADDLFALIEREPASFSGSVLLRPVIQDFLLPTLTYIGGPAEVAYFAQAAVVYEKLLGRVTPVLPRFSVTVVEPHIERLLARYNLRFEELFAPPEQVRETLAGRALPDALQGAFNAAHASLEQSLDGVTAALDGLDHTLVGAAERATAKMRYQLTRLQKRAASAEVRRSEVLARHAAQLSNALFPAKTLQERVIAGVYFLSRYPDLLHTIYDRMQPGCVDHQIINL